MCLAWARVAAAASRISGQLSFRPGLAGRERYSGADHVALLNLSSVQEPRCCSTSSHSVLEQKPQAVATAETSGLVATSMIRTTHWQCQ